MRYLWLGALLLPGLLSPGLALAEVYRWTDASGQQHFGATPPAGAERVEVKPQVMERDAATVEREQRTERFFQARREEQQRAAQQSHEQQVKRAEECQRLRANAAQLARGGSYYSLDAQGQRVYYSDSEIDTARRLLGSQLADRCP